MSGNEPALGAPAGAPSADQLLTNLRAARQDVAAASQAYKDASAAVETTLRTLTAAQEREARAWDAIKAAAS